MQVKISTRHGHLSEETQRFIKEKAEKLLHYFQRLTMIEVTVDLRDEQSVVEILASAEHKHDFVAREQHREVLSATDAAVAKIEGQLRKYKERIQEHRRAPSASDVAGQPRGPETGEE